MLVKKVSETSSMDGWDEDFAKNGLVSVLVDWNFVSPKGPLVLFNIPIVVIYKSTFRELDLD